MVMITTTVLHSYLVVHARTCVAVHAKKINNNFQTACQKQQPHRPFLRSRKRRLDWGLVFKEIEKVQKSRKKEYSKSINQEKIEKEYSSRHYPEVRKLSPHCPEVRISQL